MLQSSLLARSDRIRHAFFTRQGGVSNGVYASLNGGVGSNDDPEHVRENRARMAEGVGVAPARFLTVYQIHSPEVVTVDAPWAAETRPRADAMVTRTPNLALGISTADCGPVLFADAQSGVIGAAHAGWRGAVAGILEATIAAMQVLGALSQRISAAIGPAIGPSSYEVGRDVRDAVLGRDPADTGFFIRARRVEHWQFDLPGYCARRLAAAGLSQIATIEADTAADAEHFFSHRRRTLSGGGPIGHQISLIMLPTT